MVKTKQNVQVYLAGDMLSKGSQLLRTQEKQELKAFGVDIYNPMDNKEINDKQNLNNNDGLAEKIVKQDMQGILGADVIVIDVNQIGIGTQVELGQIHGLKLMSKIITKVLNDESLTKDETLAKIKELTQQMNDKVVLPHLEDVRRTTGENSTETGDRRSFSVNQYVLGTALELTDGVGLMDWEEVKSAVHSIQAERTLENGYPYDNYEGCQKDVSCNLGKIAVEEYVKDTLDKSLSFEKMTACEEAFFKLPLEQQVFLYKVGQALDFDNNVELDEEEKAEKMEMVDTLIQQDFQQFDTDERIFLQEFTHEFNEEIEELSIQINQVVENALNGYLKEAEVKELPKIYHYLIRLYELKDVLSNLIK